MGRADSVDDPVGSQVARRCCDRLASGQTRSVFAGPQFLASCQDCGSAAAVNRPVNTAPAKQGRVSCVDDRVDLLVRDVPEDRIDFHESGPLLASELISVPKTL